jgi:hypothetical protein
MTPDIELARAHHSAPRIETATLARAAANRARHLVRQEPSRRGNLEIGKEFGAALELLGNRHWHRWLNTEIGMSEKIARDYVQDCHRTLPLSAEEFQARMDDLNPRAARARARAKRARAKAERKAAGQPEARRPW